MREVKQCRKVADRHSTPHGLKDNLATVVGVHEIDGAALDDVDCVRPAVPREEHGRRGIAAASGKQAERVDIVGGQVRQILSRHRLGQPPRVQGVISRDWRLLQEPPHRVHASAPIVRRRFRDRVHLTGERWPFAAPAN